MKRFLDLAALIKIKITLLQDYLKVILGRWLRHPRTQFIETFWDSPPGETRLYICTNFRFKWEYCIIKYFCYFYLFFHYFFISKWQSQNLFFLFFFFFDLGFEKGCAAYLITSSKTAVLILNLVLLRNYIH